MVGFMSDIPQPLTFEYRNHRGEIGVRNCFPLRVEFRSSDWHKGPQWILVALDVDKQKERDFAFSGIIRFIQET